MRIIKSAKHGKTRKQAPNQPRSRQAKHDQTASSEFVGVISGNGFAVFDSRDDLDKKASFDFTNAYQSDRANESTAAGDSAERSETNTRQGEQSALSPAKKEFNRLLASAMRMLAMREHSVKEINDKLAKKTDDLDMLNAVLDELLENRYVSDQRFAESYVRVRANKGFGPVKIRAELANKGVSSSLIAEHLAIESPIWIDNAVAQYQKKYAQHGVKDYNEWTKRARFMQSRGFTMEHIRIALPEIEYD